MLIDNANANATRRRLDSHNAQGASSMCLYYFAQQGLHTHQGPELGHVLLDDSWSSFPIGPSLVAHGYLDVRHLSCMHVGRSVGSFRVSWNYGVIRAVKTEIATTPLRCASTYAYHMEGYKPKRPGKKRFHPPSCETRTSTFRGK